MEPTNAGEGRPTGPTFVDFCDDHGYDLRGVTPERRRQFDAWREAHRRPPIQDQS